MTNDKPIWIAGAGMTEERRDIGGAPMSRTQAASRGYRTFARAGRALVAALTASECPPCPHRNDGTMCKECNWQWSIR
ncbi:hypothetical protein MKI84_06685 [Ancylobacter sp. A5.8]|uniref:hypothetical protein n=1 Tax=Ancylobacter gelatini TaxID=2919920 RepID=UPI001F4DECB1|nr:hypothetical protein [Ancylobacter gelatini]MCJ8142600.1 hypothetical protein [Ancylobacter gelatini]